MKKLIFVLSIYTAVLLLPSCKTVKVSGNEEKIAAQTYDDAEFSRSTQEVSVSKEVFSADKTAILKIIRELSEAMQNYDYEKWITYIAPESIEYWSNQKNLLLASKRLPYKNKRLYTLNDYFRMVFVPSRQDRQVDEIRYISLDSVKAVQMKDEQDIVYYNFVKINGKWMVKLPALM